MTSLLLIAAACVTLTAAPGPWLDGAFIQLDDGSKNWKPEAWNGLLKRMQAANLSIIIVQYLEARKAKEPPTSESYVPEADGEPDPVKHILEYAGKNNMKVFLGLRFDERLMGSEFLNDPDQLKGALNDEIERNIDLATRLSTRYKLADLAKSGTFAGWYLPVEVANYKEDDGLAGTEKGWISQLNRFTTKLAAACKGLADRPIAVSPYFDARLDNGSLPAYEYKDGKIIIKNGKLPDYLVGPDEMSENYAQFLRGTGISIVMLQDGVGVRKVPTENVQEWVKPYLQRIEEACRKAAMPNETIACWANVESICADIGRLKKQIEATKGTPAARRTVVTFDFPHHLNVRPLYDDYLKLIRPHSR